MTWVRYDDNVANHPKVSPLDDATYRLWREAIEWCAHNLTDGVILPHQLAITSTRASKPRAAKLVQAGLWHLAGTPCTSKHCPPSTGDGWVIHDYWDYQPTRAKVRAEQEANRERQRRFMDKLKGRSTNASPNGAHNGVSSANPAPPRPAPKGGKGAAPPSALPAADGDGAAAATDERPTRAPNCRTCGNPRTSSYHQNVCAAAESIAHA